MAQNWAIITGGTRGIGLGVARRFAGELGYNLVLGFNANVDRASTTKRELEDEFKVQVRIVGGDVASQATIDALAAAVPTDGVLRAVVHNAGLYLGLSTNAASDEAKRARADLDKVQAKSKAPPGPPVADAEPEPMSTEGMEYYMKCYGLALGRLVEGCRDQLVAAGRNGGSVVIAISGQGSNATARPRAMYTLPGFGKSAMEFLVRQYALMLGKVGVRVNTIIPGYIDTEPWQIQMAANPNAKEWTDKRIRETPAQRWAQPEEIGDACVFLCKHSFVTGVALPVDGGLHLL